MIEGLKVTIPGTEVQALLLKRADHYKDRRAFYGKQYTKLKKAGIKGRAQQKLSSSSVTDPLQDAQERIERHTASEAEMRFLAKFVDLKEQFLLNAGDLQRLGIISSRY